MSDKPSNPQPGGTPPTGNKPAGSKPPVKPGFPGRPSSSWQLLLWLVLIWVAFYYFSGSLFGPDQLELSYSRFKTLIGEKKIAQVTIKGDSITGKFKGKYTPEPKKKAAEEKKSPAAAKTTEAKSGKPKAESTSKAQSYEYFKTTKPAITDPTLMQNLEDNGVVVYGESTGSGWLGIILISFLPWIVLIGIFIYMRNRMQGQFKNMSGGGLFGIGRSRAKRYNKSRSDVTYADVAGLENAKRDMQEIVAYMKAPEKFANLGADIPKGVLLMGPPGTGKTLLARATAGEADVPFYSISGSEFIEMFVGVGASRVRDLFDNAKSSAPSIIFIDEIDSVGRARGAGLGGGHDEREQTLNQILSEMDGFEPHSSVVVIAATNRPDVLDPALIRPGRFDRQITLERPHRQARQKILEIHTRHVPLADDIDLGNIAARTVGFSGADLKNLVNEAALLAGRRHKDHVDDDDFDNARDKILLGSEREEMFQEDEKKLIAYHEAGHVLVARLLPDTDPVQKATIIPRGRALGVTEQIPERDRHNLSRPYLLNRIAIMLGGRVSERTVFGDISNGAADDLKQATKIARAMVCQWGMSDRLGPVYVRQGEEHLFLGREISQPKDFSEFTARVIDEEIRRIIHEREEQAEELLTSHRKQLDDLAEALLHHEVLEKDDIDRIIAEAVEEPAGNG